MSQRKDNIWHRLFESTHWVVTIFHSGSFIKIHNYNNIGESSKFGFNNFGTQID